MFNLFKKGKKKKKEVVVNLDFASQDSVDLISYSGLKQEANYLEINDQFVSTMMVSGYPYVATSGWLSMLVNFNHNLDISYHLEEVENKIALPKLIRKITELESRRRTMLREGKIVGSEITDPLKSAIDLKEKIQRGVEKLFQISIYLTISASSLSELDKSKKLVESVMQSQLFYIKRATFQQLEGLRSVLPRGENILAQKRNLDSSSAALTFPFVSSELVDEKGVLFGINKSNNSLVIIDRFRLNNANSIIFAQSGAGKSYSAKVEILRQLMQGSKVIVIDPEREYKRLAKSIKGSYIKLSSNSKEKINPFEYLKKNSDGENRFGEQIHYLSALISVMVGGLSNEEKAIVDKILIKTYKQANKGEHPLLKDFYYQLKKIKAKDLVVRLEPYVKGSKSKIFESQTNIKMDKRLIVFDIKELNQELRPLMMMVIANFVNNEVKEKIEKRLLVIDEAWMLLEDEKSAQFISDLVRRARKYFLGVTIISQQASDFLNNDQGRVLASQSALRILMRQDSTTIKRVVQEFNLSNFEKQYLLTCDRGEALIIADQNHVAVKIVASDCEDKLITTDPNEIYGNKS